MKPKLYEVEFMGKEELTDGIVLGIVDEFKNNPKFQGFLTGTVLLPNAEKRLLTLNKTSFKAIKAVYGDETLGWIGKNIVYKGTCKMGAMQGKLFEALK